MGMVVLLFTTFSTRLRSVFSSAAISERIASAHTSTFRTSSRARSRVSRCDTTSDAAAVIRAAITMTVLIVLYRSVQSILLLLFGVKTNALIRWSFYCNRL